MQSIVTGPFVLFKQLASAIDLSGTFTVFIVDFAEDFTFLVWLSSPFFKTVVDHLFHPLRIFSAIWFLVVDFTLRFVELFGYEWFIKSTDFVGLKNLLSAASSCKIIFVSEGRFVDLSIVRVGMSIVWVGMGVKRHSVAFRFGIAELFRRLIEWWASVKDGSTLFFDASLTEVDMDGFGVCPEGIVLKKRLVFSFPPCVGWKSMLRTESGSAVWIFEEVVFSSWVIFRVVNLNSLARQMRIAKLIDWALIEIFCSEFGFG